MKARILGSTSVAAVFASGMVVFGQQPAQPQTQAGARSSMDQPIAVTGCIQREADYRQARDAGRGGVAGTGVGAGNEFVLTDATSSTSARTGAEPASPTGTAGAASAY